MITTKNSPVDTRTAPMSATRVDRDRRKSVLVIATTRSLRHSISRILARVPFEVHSADTADGGLASARTHRPDLVVVESELATSMPRYLHDVREAGGAPIMLVGPDRAEGSSSLESGTAVDYLSSPVWWRELQARALRHAGARVDDLPIRSFGDLRIDRRARAVSVGGKRMGLTSREFDLVDFLASHPGTVFTRRQLLERVWGSSTDWQQADTVTEHIYRLRRKLEPDPASPKYILTVPSSGYCFGGVADSSAANRKAG